MSGAVLEHTPSSFVNRLRTGSMLVGAGILLMVGIFVVPFVVTSVYSHTLNPVVLGWIVGIGLLIGHTMSLLGWWGLTTPPPGFAAHGGETQARLLVRGATVAMVLLALAGVMRTMLPAAPEHAEQLLDRGSGAVSWVGMAVQFFAGLWLMRWIARRIPSGRLASAAVRNMWLVPLIAVAGLPFWLVGALVVALLWPLAALIVHSMFFFQVQGALGKLRPQSTNGAPSS